MEYWRIKKRTFNEIIITALLGMLISLSAVLYLLNEISVLNRVIVDLRNQEPVVITKFLEIENEEKNQKKVIEMLQQKMIKYIILVIQIENYWQNFYIVRVGAKV